VEAIGCAELRRDSSEWRWIRYNTNLHICTHSHAHTHMHVHNYTKHTSIAAVIVALVALVVAAAIIVAVLATRVAKNLLSACRQQQRVRVSLGQTSLSIIPRPIHNSHSQQHRKKQIDREQQQNKTKSNINYKKQQTHLIRLYFSSFSRKFGSNLKTSRPSSLVSWSSRESMCVIWSASSTRSSSARREGKSWRVVASVSTL